MLDREVGERRRIGRVARLGPSRPRQTELVEQHGLQLLARPDVELPPRVPIDLGRELIDAHRELAMQLREHRDVDGDTGILNAREDAGERQLDVVVHGTQPLLLEGSLQQRCELEQVGCREPDPYPGVPVDVEVETALPVRSCTTGRVTSQVCGHERGERMVPQVRREQVAGEQGVERDAIDDP